MSVSKETGAVTQPPLATKFVEGEKLLCFHGPLLYEAKCLETQYEDGELEYFVHYSGWNKKWDEWVPDSRLLKYNDANLQRQKELEKEHLKPKSKKMRKEPAAPSQEKGPKRRKMTTSTSSATGSAAAPGVKETAKMETSKKWQRKLEATKGNGNRIKIIPKGLNTFLQKDLRLVTKQEKLVILPARISVEDVLAEYLKQKTGKEGAVYHEMVNSLREYFNVMLKQVIYKFEKPQYQNMLSKNSGKPMSDIYSAIHLLRLFAKVGAILPHVPLNEIDSQVLKHIHEFLKFVSMHSSDFFSLRDYEKAPLSYIEKASAYL